MPRQLLRPLTCRTRAGLSSNRDTVQRCLCVWWERRGALQPSALQSRCLRLPEPVRPGTARPGGVLVPGERGPSGPGCSWICVWAILCHHVAQHPASRIPQRSW